MIARIVVRLLLAALFLTAGYLHFKKTDLFLLIMPPAIPFPRACVIISGIFEILAGLGLLVPVRNIELLTGWGLVLLLVAVFPANIYMAVQHIEVPGLPKSPWFAWLRLPLQPLLILAVVWVTRIWPVSK